MATPTEVAIVRSLIPDSEAVFGDAENETLFSDTEIGHFLSAGGGSVLRAAALANMAIATSEALISKKIRTQDLQTDGPAVANALVNKATILFQRADKEDATANMEFFQIVNFEEGWYPVHAELTEF